MDDSDLGYYSQAKVMKLTSLSRSTLWRLRQEGAFPELYSIPGTKRRKGYFKHEIHQWLEGNWPPKSNLGDGPLPQPMVCGPAPI